MLNATWLFSLFAYKPPRRAVQTKHIRDSSSGHKRGLKKYRATIWVIKETKRTIKVVTGMYSSIRSTKKRPTFANGVGILIDYLPIRIDMGAFREESPQRGAVEV
jgi:hypothetical protein